MSLDSKLTKFRGPTWKAAMRTSDKKVYCRHCGKTHHSRNLKQHWAQAKHPGETAAALQAGETPVHLWNKFWKEDSQPNASLDSYFDKKRPTADKLDPLDDLELS